MMALAVILSVVLLAIAALHLLWGIGFWWPIRDEAGLARAVVGRAGITRMPGAVPCASVGTALMVLASWLYLPQEIWFVRAGTGIAAGVFVLRGIAAWVPAFQRITPEPAFRRLDTALYGPLCLAIGAGLAVFAIGG
jgi:hypothetical protein